MNESDNKLPKSALALYVKLYCKKKGSSSNKNNLLVEATKSWVSLSKDDKQYFRNALKDQELKLRKKIALSLQNAQPYLKKKGENAMKSRSPKINKDFDAEVKIKTHVDCHMNSIEEQETNEQSCYFPVNNEIPHDDEQTPKINKELDKEVKNETHIDFYMNSVEDQVTYEQSCNSPDSYVIPHENEQLENFNTDNTVNPVEGEHRMVEQDNIVSIPEPTPPLRSSMELFDIIKSNEESPQNSNWAELSKSQKRRYQRALQSIKNDYINKYKSYLDQLTPEQLFCYYKSKF